MRGPRRERERERQKKKQMTAVLSAQMGTQGEEEVIAFEIHKGEVAIKRGREKKKEKKEMTYVSYK